MSLARPLTDHYQVRGNLTFVGKWIDCVWTSGHWSHNIMCLFLPGTQNLNWSVSLFPSKYYKYISTVSSVLVAFLYFCLSQIFFGHYGSLRLCLGCLVCTLCGPIIIKTLAADMTFCWKKDIKVRAVLRHYNDIGHPLGLSRVHCTGPIWSWTDNYDTIWRRGKMLLLVLQPLILYCVNNKLLAIKLNRLRVMFLKSPELYLNMTKNTTLMCSCWSLIVDLSRFISP